MPMTYTYTAIPDTAIPLASAPAFHTPANIYASETNKVVSVWQEFSAEALSFRPHPRSSTAQDIFKHQLLSERRFFGEFLGLPEPPAAEVLPENQTPEGYIQRMTQLALPRLNFLAARNEDWWLEVVLSSMSSASASGFSGDVCCTRLTIAHNLRLPSSA